MMIIIIKEYNYEWETDFFKLHTGKRFTPGINYPELLIECYLSLKVAVYKIEAVCLTAGRTAEEISPLEQAEGDETEYSCV